MRAQRRRLFALCVLTLLASLLAGTGAAAPATASAWSGSIVEFRATRPVIDVTTPESQVQFQVTNDLGGGAVGYIVDSTGKRVVTCRYSVYCYVNVWPSADTTETYTAYVGAEDSATEGPPATIYATAGPVSITNVGYVGQITSFTASRTLVPWDGMTSLQVDASPAVGYPYRWLVFDNHDQWLSQYCSGATCYVSGLYPRGQVSWYYAYIGRIGEVVYPPRNVRAAAGPIAVSRLPEDQIASAPEVVALVAQLTARYGDDLEACLMLGEKIRTHVSRSSVPDVTLVCNSKGLDAAIQLAMNLAGAGATLGVIEALIDGVEGTTPEVVAPDCHNISFDGTCLDESGAEAPPAPALEPDPSGAGSGVPPNCLSGAARQDLIDSMPNEFHHMATWYGEWGARFQKIADRYGLSVQDSARSWNVYELPHKGPHPWNYHNWVYGQMIEADELAQEAPVDRQADVFVDEFTSRVVGVVQADPTIFRAAYWRCKDEYRWR